LFTTEDFYCSCLHYLLDSYKPCLAQLKGENGESLVSDAVIKSLFSTVQILVNVNDKLRDKLKKRMENWFLEECRVGNIFDKSQVGFLKVYISFVNSYDQASMHLRAIGKNEQVKLELERIRTDPESPKNLDIASLLIMPIQRLPRYVLLLQDLLAHTPSNHVDFPDLQKALDGVVEVASDVNLKKKTNDNVVAVALIRQRLIFSGMEQSVGLEKYFPNSASRVYITQGYLNFYETDKNETIKISEISNLKLLTSQWKTHYIFLFSDTLIITSEVEGSQSSNLLSGWRDKIWTKTEDLKTWSIEELREKDDVNFKFITKIDLAGLEIIDSHTANQSNILNSNAFGLVKRGSKVTTQLFSCPDEKLKKNWIVDFDGAIWGILKNKRTRAEIHNQPPQKQVATQTGPLSINFKGSPGDWVKKFCVLQGTNLVLYDGENDFLSATNPNKIAIAIDSADIVLWPSPGAVTFLDLEKQEEYTDKEASLMQAFLLRATGQAPDLATIQAQTGEGKDKMIELLAPHGNPHAAVKTKYYFMIDKIKGEDGILQTWYFSCSSPEVRMKWLNKLRQAIHRSLEPIVGNESQTNSTPDKSVVTSGHRNKK